ncbi:MAG: hypothetical protein GXP38_06115 [Chloroflexi bacterium]|nr:hypothetical protein [Chloroflexota bacterium]
MSAHLVFTRTPRPWQYLFLIPLAFVLALFLTPNVVFADPPAPAKPGSETCTLCHWRETSQWQHSPHASNDVVCESCHGEYVEGHPDKADMKLSVDPVCHDCHEANYEQWSASLHAQDNVTCISCHVPHSQTTRLNSQELCISCHDDDVGKTWDLTAHKLAGVTCVDCHLSQPDMEPWGQETDAQGHVFTVVPSQLCINCHAENLHAPALTTRQLAAGGHQLASLAPQQMEDLSRRIAETEKENAALQNWVLIMLGVGLGVGLMLGIVVMLLIGYVQNHKESAT